MAKHYFINETVWINEETYSLKPQGIHSKKTSGTIKGLKRHNESARLYLIEFLNHNRIWIIEKEIQKNFL